MIARSSFFGDFACFALAALIAVPVTAWTQDEVASVGAISSAVAQPATASTPAVDLSADASGVRATAVRATGAAYVRPQARRRDLNRDIYYANRLELGLDTGYLPNNIPFVFDRLVGIYDRTPPRDYTLVPFIFSLRWQFTDVASRGIFRGNWDLSLSAAYTMIPRSLTTAGNMLPSGAETRYWAHLWGIRRNFVQPNWRVAPYAEGRIGFGNINAKEPYGALWAQGQDLTFTVMMGAGARYNFNSRYSLSAGVNYMHISNLYLSEPKYLNYGINVYGPAFGFSMRLGRPRSEAR